MTEESSQALVPIETRSVDFYGETIVAVLVRTGDETQVYVPIKPICTYLGLDWSAQRQRMQRDEVLREGMVVITIPSEGGPQSTVCLPLDCLPGWLFGITAARVKPELQDKITRYRRECFRVLWRAFQADLTQNVSVPGTISPLAQVRNLALAVAQMAEQQLVLEQRTTALELRETAHDVRLDRAAAVVGELRRRMEKAEDQLHPTSLITEEQAAEISLRVKALAELLTRRGYGKTSYQTIFAALYHHFGVSSYKFIRREQFDSVLAQLDDWRQAALEGKAPVLDAPAG